MAEVLTDDDIVPTYRAEETDDDGDACDIINSAKKMRASGLSYEKVKVFSDGKCAEEEAVKYNNFKCTYCKINDIKQGTKNIINAALNVIQIFQQLIRYNFVVR